MRRLAALLGALCLCAACSEPPQKELDRAHGAIDAARAAGAERYAATEFTASTSALKEAHDAVEQRDYRLALTKALDANERALQAARQAADGKASARSEAEQAIAAVSLALQQLQGVVKSEGPRMTAPALTSAKHDASSAEAALQKARALLKADQYLEARDALAGVQEQIATQLRATNDAARARTVRRRS
jgi:hypothetical protein